MDSKNKKINFWQSIKKLQKLEIKIDNLREKYNKISAANKQIKELMDMGFSVVIYENDRVGIVNFTKPKRNDSYYSAVFCEKNQKLENDYDGSNPNPHPFGDEDYLKIQKILELEVEK